MLRKIEYVKNSWVVGCFFFFLNCKSCLVKITQNSDLFSLVAYVTNSRLSDIPMTLREKGRGRAKRIKMSQGYKGVH